MALQSYAVSQSQAGQLRGYMALAAFCAAGAVQAALRPLFAAAEAFAGKLLLGPVRLAARCIARGKLPAPPPKYGGTKKDLQKNRKRACQHHGVCCIIQTYQSESTGALGLLSENGRHCVMANPSRKKRKRKASVVGAVLKLLFLLLLLSMLAAYIANQVALSSKSGAGHPAGADRPAEDPERGDAAHPQRRLGRCDRVGCAGLLQLCGGQRAHLRGCDGQLMPRPERLAAGGKHISQQGVLSFGD